VWTIVVAGGHGSRFGRAKQYEPLGAARVLDHSVDAARAVSDGVVLVVPHYDLAEAEAAADVIVAGGATRAESVRSGLAAVPSEAAVILVHDAARPLASTALFRSVVEAVQAGAEAVVPAVAVTDTLRGRDGGVVDRDRLVAVQTPQGFRADVLRAAHERGGEATDDAGLVERHGATVTVVPGEPSNRKITDPDDLVVAAALLARGAAALPRTERTP
jgi:2-C-methyl-D-erythritol 4-phosphate cytidylyltransferase